MKRILYKLSLAFMDGRNNMFIAKEHIENNPTNVCFPKRAMNMLRYFMLFIRAIENLNDTNNAGTKKGTDCTLYLRRETLPRRSLSQASLSWGVICMGATPKLTTQNKATKKIYVNGCFVQHSRRWYLPMSSLRDDKQIFFI